MSEQIQVPDYIIAGKAFKYRDYDERLAKAFNYDYESLELNRDKSLSIQQQQFLVSQKGRKAFVYGASGTMLLFLLIANVPQFYREFIHNPLSVQSLLMGLAIWLITHSIVVWRQYTRDVEHDLTARVIGIPYINVRDTGYIIAFGEQRWSLSDLQFHACQRILQSPDSPDGQYFVAYYTPKTKHLLSIEPITLVQDFTEQSESDTSGQTSDRPYFIGLDNVWAYIIAWWKYLRDR